MEPKWCSAFDKKHTKQCMGPRYHTGMHFCIEVPNYDDKAEPVKGYWWEDNG